MDIFSMSLNLMLANMFAADLATVPDCPKCMRDNTLTHICRTLFYRYHVQPRVESRRTGVKK